MPDTIKQTSLIPEFRAGQYVRWRPRLAKNIPLECIVITPSSWSRDRYWVRERSNPRVMHQAHATELEE